MRQVPRIRGTFSFLSALVWAACAPPAAQPPTVDLGVSPTPATVGNARVMVQLRDSTGAVIEGAAVRLEGRLMDTDAVVTQRNTVEESAGRYVVSDFRFPSAGVWLVEVIVQPTDASEARVTREVRVVGGGPS